MRYQQKITTRMSTTKHVILSVSGSYFHKNAYARYAFKFGFLSFDKHDSITILNTVHLNPQKQQNLGIREAGIGLPYNENWA